jgi:hypothetical protein
MTGAPEELNNRDEKDKTKGNVINDLTSQEVASCIGPSTEKPGTMGSEKQSYRNRVPQPIYRLPLPGRIVPADSQPIGMLRVRLTRRIESE